MTKRDPDTGQIQSINGRTGRILAWFKLFQPVMLFLLGAILIPLTQLNERLSSLDASKPTIVYCAGGFRSSIAASRMAKAGFGDVSDLLGGYGAWESVPA